MTNKLIVIVVMTIITSMIMTHAYAVTFTPKIVIERPTDLTIDLPDTYSINPIAEVSCPTGMTAIDGAANAAVTVNGVTSKPSGFDTSIQSVQNDQGEIPTSYAFWAKDTHNGNVALKLAVTCTNLTDTVALNSLQCTTNQIAKFDGTKWICSNMPNLDVITYKVKSNIVNVTSSAGKATAALCDSGDSILGGGHERLRSNNDLIITISSKPINQNGRDGWNSDFKMIPLGGIQWATIQVHGICLDRAPFH